MTTFTTFFADDHPRPAGFLACPEELTPYLTMIDNGRFEEALATLLDVKQFEGMMGVAWARYLKGVALFSLNLHDAGLDEFNFVLAHMEAIDRSEEHRDGFRMAALCLKKIGWYEREEQNYKQAYHDHFRVFDIAERFGSYEELHDAAINLVIDCRFLNDAKAADEWLQKSIAAAERIEDEHARNRALAICRVHQNENISK